MAALWILFACLMATNVESMAIDGANSTNSISPNIFEDLPSTNGTWDNSLITNSTRGFEFQTKPLHQSTPQNTTDTDAATIIGRIIGLILGTSAIYLAKRAKEQYKKYKMRKAYEEIEM